MTRSSICLILAVLLLPMMSAYAAPPPAQRAQTTAYEAPATWNDPSLVSFGLGYVDFDKDEKRTRSADFRLEYRWGQSLWSSHNSVLDFGIHPLAGLDVSTRSQIYGFGGFAFDLLFWKHLVLTESEAVGLFDSGDAKPLGSFVEFRSQAELGWRFDNNMRLTTQISHISNAGLTKRNPGEEIAGVYLHIPVGMFCGR